MSGSRLSRRPHEKVNSEERLDSVKSRLTIQLFSFAILPLLLGARFFLDLLKPCGKALIFFKIDIQGIFKDFQRQDARKVAENRFI